MSEYKIICTRSMGACPEKGEARRLEFFCFDDDDLQRTTLLLKTRCSIVQQRDRGRKNTVLLVISTFLSQF